MTHGAVSSFLLFCDEDMKKYDQRDFSFSFPSQSMVMMNA